jgi:CheY-like chemotaxis protein
VTYKLLLADDSITIQKVVELILEEEDFEIRSANNGEEALAALKTFRPDIVLADVEMPVMNGYQLCEKIKQSPETKEIPVILLTGAFEPVDQELAKHVGADDFIVKPFESQELLSKINASLASSLSASESNESALEAEALAEEEAEDLWAMEEIPETAEILSWTAEEAAALPQEEVLEIVGNVQEDLSDEKTAPSPAAPVKVAGELQMPSADEVRKIFKAVLEDKVAAAIASMDINESVVSALAPALRDSVEKILWEVAPDLIERMLKEILAEALGSLTKQVERVIWETVPDLAETMISKEIERIRSEF